MEDRKHLIAVRKDVYSFINRIWNRLDKKHRVDELLKIWTIQDDDFKKEFVSNISPDDAVYIIDHILKS